MFPMLSPRQAKKGIAPLAICSRCFTPCQNIIGINFGALDDKEEQGFSFYPDSGGSGLDTSVESREGEVMEDV